MSEALAPLEPGAARSVPDLVAGLGWAGDLSRPRVLAAMIASADGRAAVQGRSVGLGHPADRALLRELRGTADAVLVGSRTIAAERYAQLLDPGHVEARAARGQPPHPLVATISRDLDLETSAGLFAEEGVPIVVYAEAEGELSSRGADVRVRRMESVTPEDVVADLGGGHPRILCEGGPGLLRLLVAAGVLDELLLTVSPLLVAGTAPTSLSGDVLDPPCDLELLGTHRAGDHLFAHYALHS